MAQTCQLYYITDRTQFPGDEHARRRALLATIAEAARTGVDFIQLREKDLSARALEDLARECVGIIQQEKIGNRELTIRLLINSRTDVALPTGADGVHLRSDDVSPAAVRSVWGEANARFVQSQSQLPTRVSTIAVSCHSSADIARAESEGADFAVFAPVFQKKEEPETKPRGLSGLRAACAAKIPVFALGGVTLENTASCLAAGAAGIAGIRLFQENKIEHVVRILRAI